MKPVTTTQPLTAFELTDAELTWAHRFFRATRSMDLEAREAVLTFVDVAELTQARSPLHAKPTLRLVGGAA